jgi:hypothetical protein
MDKVFLKMRAQAQERVGARTTQEPVEAMADTVEMGITA